MYEKRLKNISNGIHGTPVKFILLSNKKTKREIYFRNNSKAIEFIKKKMTSSGLKKILYFLIKKNLPQLFLKKIYLSSNLGEVIFVANRVKGFDLNNRIVISFPLKEENRENFLKFLEIRKKLGNIAPKLIETNKKVPYYKEELLEPYEGSLFLPLQKLKKFNKKTGLIHGDLVKEHILKKGNSCVFTDWEDVRKGSFEEDFSKIKNWKKAIVKV